MTITATTRNGQPAYLITCGCGAHPLGDTAILSEAAGMALAARKGKAQSDRIHGHVNLAHHPALSRAPQIRANGPWKA